MISLDTYLESASTVAISGHVRPDGDCAGACLAAYNYITDNYPDMRVDLFLEPLPEKFLFLKNADKIRQAGEENDIEEYDLFLALDCSDVSRLGKAVRYFEKARETFCVDHHISNDSFADFNYVFPKASSASELVYELLDKDRITKEIAECIYLGLVHDTGVFQYSCTSSKTMNIAGEMMDKGIDYPRIVDDTFYIKTYSQNKILGRALYGSEMHLGGKVIYSLIKKKHLDKCHARPIDLDGVVSQMRSTVGVEVAILIYPNEDGTNKISLRSASYVDVAAVAAEFGGGGHCRAAGASAKGKPEDIIKKLLSKIKVQIKQHEAYLEEQKKAAEAALCEAENLPPESESAGGDDSAGKAGK